MLGIILTILIFIIIINIHELGHFLAAKLFKVRVNEFSFGMGPHLYTKTVGETTYSICAFPIGGYVAMDGEDSYVENSDGRALCDKKPWQRFIILFAGSFMNLLLGLILVFGLTVNSELIGTNKILKITDSKFENILQPNDTILFINSHSTPIYDDVIFQILRDADGIVDMTVERIIDGKPQKIELKDLNFKADTNTPDGKMQLNLGIVLLGNKNTPAISASYSFHRTISIIKQVWFSLFDILTGRYGLSELSGPIGTTQIVSDAIQPGPNNKIDLMPFFTLFAFITINVGIFNLLPLPALDGGRIVFVLLEMIFRRPVAKKYEGYVHAGGMILLFILIIVITIKDIIYIFIK